MIRGYGACRSVLTTKSLFPQKASAFCSHVSWYSIRLELLRVVLLNQFRTSPPEVALPSTHICIFKYGTDQKRTERFQFKLSLAICMKNVYHRMEKRIVPTHVQRGKVGDQTIIISHTGPCVQSAATRVTDITNIYSEIAARRLVDLDFSVLSYFLLLLTTEFGLLRREFAGEYGVKSVQQILLMTSLGISPRSKPCIRFRW